MGGLSPDRAGEPAAHGGGRAVRHERGRGLQGQEPHRQDAAGRDPPPRRGRRVMTPCPSTELWSRLLDEGLPPHEQAVYESHLEECGRCQRVLDELTVLPAVRAGAPDAADTSLVEAARPPALTLLRWLHGVPA